MHRLQTIICPYTNDKIVDNKGVSVLVKGFVGDSHCSHCTLMVDGSFVVQHISYSQKACLEQTRTALNHTRLIGKRCYDALWNLTAPCGNCPIQDYTRDNFDLIHSHFQQGLLPLTEKMVSESIIPLAVDDKELFIVLIEPDNEDGDSKDRGYVLHSHYHRLFYRQFYNYRLTHTEQEVAIFILQGLSSKEIAHRLFISKKAVDFHRHNIRKKLGLIGKRLSINDFLQNLVEVPPMSDRKSDSHEKIKGPAINTAAEIRLKEQRHRTTNFLNMLSGMMRLKMDKLKTEEAHYICTEMLSIIEAYNQIFYLLNEKSGTDGHTTISSQYLFSKIVAILESFPPVQEQKVYIEPEIEAVELHNRNAIPLALITIESFTNTLKYAFPPEFSGKRIFTLQFKELSPTKKLTLRDNGVGAAAVKGPSPPSTKPEEGGGADDSPPEAGSGIGIMKSLAQQIDGELDVDFSQGTVVQLHYNPEQ